MAFLRQTDFDVQLRDEIAAIIDDSEDRSKLLIAEKMAISQMKNHLAGKYDVSKIFQELQPDDEDTRDQYIVMLVIDILVYHLWSKEGRNNMPKLRELRYTDALKWLQDAQKGAATDLPLIQNEDGEDIIDIRIWSKHIPESNKF